MPIHEGKVGPLSVPVRRTVIPIGWYVDETEIEDAIVDGPLGRIDEHKCRCRIGNLHGLVLDSGIERDAVHVDAQHVTAMPKQSGGPFELGVVGRAMVNRQRLAVGKYHSAFDVGWILIFLGNSIKVNAEFDEEGYSIPWHVDCRVVSPSG